MANLASIQNWCRQHGERLTPARKAVYELLSESDQALTAYQLLEQLQAVMPHAKPPTVYRALEFLRRLGLVHRVDSQNAFVLCSDFPHSHDAAFLVCRQCGGVREVDAASLIGGLRELAAARDFQYQHSTIEVRGLCHDCQSSSAA